jgi:voltage-gated potassium channel
MSDQPSPQPTAPEEMPSLRELPQPMRRQMLLLVFGYPISMARALTSPNVRPLMVMVAILLASGSVFYHTVEGWSWLDSLYFCVVTLATVGYGDLTPERPISKIVTMIYIVIGIGLLVAFINALTDISFLRLKEKRQEIVDRQLRDDDSG